MAYNINLSSSGSDLGVTGSFEEEEVQDVNVNGDSSTFDNDPYRFGPINTDVDQDPQTFK